MKIAELLAAVKDERLTRKQLEDYHSECSHLAADLKLRISELKKAKALYIVQSEEESQVAKRDQWNATEEGQKLITYVGYLGALQTERDSLKNRIYATL